MIKETQMKLIKDLGMQFATQKSKKKTRFGLYECPHCEKPYKANSYSVNSGASTKCNSCAMSIIATTHGDSKTRLFEIWQGMKKRCNNKNHKNYNDYGGRGIKVCKEWLNNYETFREWALNNGYSDDLSIDRIDVNLNYEANNCRWTDKYVQSQNTRKMRVNNTSGYRGVVKRSNSEKWVAQIGINNNQVYLGQFDYPWTGAYAYDSYILSHNLEHTRNFTL
jgi:ribosomal protein S27E